MFQILEFSEILMCQIFGPKMDQICENFSISFSLGLNLCFKSVSFRQDRLTVFLLSQKIWNIFDSKQARNKHDSYMRHWKFEHRK